MPPQRRLGHWEFARYEALGNDYLIVDAEAFGAVVTGALAVWLCQRHHGVGSDGLLVRLRPGAHDTHRLQIFNPDGSEAEKSGNGLRIFARFLRDFGYAPAGPMAIDTLGGHTVASLQPDLGCAGTAETITVAMGQAVFDSTAVRASGPKRCLERESLQIDGAVLDTTAVSLGNPHCVVFGAAMDTTTLRRLGPKIERHALFEAGTNVQLAQVQGRRSLDILIWERGAGETLASGSSSCAAAAAAVRRGLMDSGAWLSVRMPGGALQIYIAPDWSVRMQGSAEAICRGALLRLPEALARPA